MLAIHLARFDAVSALAMSIDPRIPATIDVAALRRRTGLSQDAFARHIGVSLFTLRGWEQGRRAPEGPARVLLALLTHNPNVVEETLGSLPDD